MKTRIFLSFLAVLFCTTLTSCYRSRCEMWEDTKTCGRYVNKGFRSLFGQHIDSREYATYYKNWNDSTSSEADYEPLADAEPTQSYAMQDYAPASRESPGDPGSKIPGIEGFSSPSGKLAELFKNIHFDTDNYSISGENNLHNLREIVSFLISHPNQYVFVEGHADERGAAAYNLALGSRRANAIRNYLIQNGVSPDQLFAISYGLERPTDTSHTADAWKKNRRGQFKLFAR